MDGYRVYYHNASERSKYAMYMYEKNTSVCYCEMRKYLRLWHCHEIFHVLDLLKVEGHIGAQHNLNHKRTEISETHRVVRGF